MRAGVRDGYTRLVFGWDKAVTYDFKDDGKGAVEITFDTDADVNFEGDALETLKIIRNVEVAETKPLKIRFQTPVSSKKRDFNIGKRVVVDIYDPENPDDMKAFVSNDTTPAKPEEEQVSEPLQQPDDEVKHADGAPVTEKPPAPKVDGQSHDAHAAVEAPKKETAKYELVPERMPQVRPKPVEREILQPKDVQKKALANAVEQVNHVISVRSMQAIPMAAFVQHGDMYIVVGDSSAFRAPTLSSEEPQLFGDIQRVSSNDTASVYKMKLPKNHDFPVQSRGDGLVWDIILGDKVKEPEALEPIRIAPEDKYARGGKLIWPMKNVSNIIDITDPLTGAAFKVVMVDDGEDYIGRAQSYIDFDVLFSPLGMAIYPKVDDLRIEKTDKGVEISRPIGLAIMSKSAVNEAKLFRDRHYPAKKASSHSTDASGHHDTSHGDDGDHGTKDEHQLDQFLFQFRKWQLGKASDIEHNENLLLDGMHTKTAARKVEDLLALGKMFASFGRGAEALGYFDYALSEVPKLDESAEFHALRGVARALDWKSEGALEDFLYPELDDFDEVKFWTSYVLADLGDWQQAIKVLPVNFEALHSYPPNIATRLSLKLAEVSLRDGKVAQAKELMAIAEHHKDHMLPAHKAEYKYLQGEAARQANEINVTKKLWSDLTKDQDDLYRTKAGLALAILQQNEKEISNDEAIDRLERLRYAWRGDELEAQINYWLGDAYFKGKKYVKGLSIMRDAVSFADQDVLAERITADMAETFKNMYLSDALKNVSPLDAVAVYEQFSELTPVGPEGDLLVQRLAEHLVRADLLGRATKLLQYQVDHRLDGEERIRIAIRLAAIELIDKKPQKAINALGKAENTMLRLSASPKKAQYQREIDLLRVRAYSQNKQHDKALKLLEKLPVDRNTSNLRADISWLAGYWGEAADALNTILVDENISPKQDLTPEQSTLIMNRAISLSLDNDRIALANMREKYSSQMGDTPKANQFELITRPRRNSELADRETLLSAIQEVDLFKDFLDSYREDPAPTQ